MGGGSGRLMARLTQMQEAFCLEYYRTGNATQSAITAGYSQLTAQEQSSRLLSNVIIEERMAELNKPQAERAGATVDERRELLSKFANEDNCTDKGSLVRSGNISAIAELNKMDGAYEPEKYEVKSVTLHIVHDDEGKG